MSSSVMFDSLLLLQCLLEFPPAVLTNSLYHLSVLPAFPEFVRAVLCVCVTALL